MNGNCRDKPLLDARSAQSAIGLGGIGGLIAGAAAVAITGSLILGGAWNGGILVTGAIWGYCLARFFGRLQVHQEKICASGLVVNPGRVSFFSVWFAPFLWDPDFVWDLIPIGAHVRFVFDNATHPRCNDENQGLLHCEIDSAIKTTGCIGAMIGAAIGAAIGIAVLVPLLAASAFCDPFVFLCVILAFLIAAAAAYLGAYIGALIGHLVGHLIDVISGAGDEFEAIQANTCMAVTGRWVIDLDHGWNEIHPVEFFTDPALNERN